jgi:ADP-ribose pyrophosphatase YjhB (NUDIX family)
VTILGDDWVVCPRCRTALTRVVRGDLPRPTCTGCGFVFFANPGVGAAVVIRDAAGRVLLVQRGPGQFGAGRWCFPCGFVEWGEDVRAAAAREAREEAGVAVEIGEPVQVASNFHEPEKPTVGIWFAASLRDPAAAAPVAGDDAVAVGWFDPARPPPLAFPTDAALLAKLADPQRGRAVTSTSAPSATPSAAVRKRRKRRLRAR